MTDQFKDRLLVRPDEAAEALGLSRSRIFEMIADETLPSIKIGKSRRIPYDALKQWVADQMDKQIGDRK